MNRNSNNSEFDPVRHQLEGVHESAAELIRQSELLKGTAGQPDADPNVGDPNVGEHANSESSGSDSNRAEFAAPESNEELIAWLSESEGNRAKYEMIREFDRSMAGALADLKEFEPGLEERIKCVVQSDKFVEEAAASGKDDDYQFLFDASESNSDLSDSYDAISNDAFSNDKLQQSKEQTLELARSNASQQEFIDNGTNRPGKNHRKSKTNKSGAVRWWLATVGTLASTAAIVLVAFLIQPDPQQPEVNYTAEMLCEESLNWNPNQASGTWNSDLTQAPANRMFPKHLVRLKAQSWKKMEIEGDQQGVVYNLIPDGNLAEPKAYLYVFRTDGEFELPGQFASHATSNRKYRFWSVACRQDLVFVIVYEGEEKRLHDLIKIQQVG